MINLIVYVILLNTSVVLASQENDGGKQLPNDVNALQEMVKKLSALLQQKKAMAKNKDALIEQKNALLQQKDALLKERREKMLQFFDFHIKQNELIPEWEKEELEHKILNTDE